MPIIASAFLVGILLVQQCSTLPSFYWLICCAFITGYATYRRYPILGFFCLGILWASFFGFNQLKHRLLEEYAGIDTVVTGTLVNLPEISGDLARFDFAVIDSPSQIPQKIRLSWQDSGNNLKNGQTWTFTVKLKPPHGTRNLGSFDYERWLFTEGIGATGFVRPYPKPMLIAQAPTCSIGAWRQALYDRFSALSISSENKALLKALVIGAGSDLSVAQWNIFRQTGTTHLVVISGSHIVLIAGLAYGIVIRLWAWSGILSWAPQRVAAVVGLLAGIVYAGLAGFSVPTQRATVMLTVMMLAIIWQRPVRPLHTLAMALFAVLLYDPLAVLLPGFWLSFGAVALIVYAITGRLAKLSFWREMLHINWVTSLGLSPLLLWFFQQVSLCAPLANAFAVPVISLILVPMALAATILLFISQPIANALIAILDVLLNLLMRFLSELAKLPFATINHPSPSWPALLLAIAGLLLMLAPRAMPMRYVGLALLMPLLLPSQPKLASGEFKMTLLDIGQGLAAVVQTANHWLVYDTGAKLSTQSDSGQQVVVPFLRHEGVLHLDKLIISHGDNDHIGGADSVLQAIPTGSVLTSVPEQLASYAPSRCIAGQTWHWDEVTFTVLSPSSMPFDSDNNNSCVVKISSIYGSVLLTGDIEMAAEIALVKTYREQLRAEMLVAAHHGSKTSSTYSFLQTVKPDTVLIPAGYRNAFGHPHPKILHRYQEMDINWLNTAQSGAITLQFMHNGRILESLRQTEARYWQTP